MNDRYVLLFQSAGAPLILISGLGIYILMLNARYTHVIGRIREIYALGKSKELSGQKYKKELSLLIQRGHILKWSMGLLVLSTVFSSFLVLLSTANAILGVNVFYVAATLLPIISLLIMSSMVLLFYDIKKSLISTIIHIQDDEV